MTPTVLDATAGGKHIWHPQRKDADHVVYADCRAVPKGELELQPGWSVSPDVLADARQLPFANETFDLVCFDPPHQITEDGMERLSGVIPTKYGALRAETWQGDLRAAFDELWRVLRPGGTLTFKWADRDKTSEDVLAQIDQTPLYGTVDQNRTDRSGTKWWAFYKPRKVGRLAPVAADGGFTEANGGGDK